MSKNSIVKGVESLINPISVGTLHFFQQYNDMLPTSVQKKIVAKSATKNPYMGFVVEPYCTFLFQKIIDVEYFESIIPNNFKLNKCSPFADEQEDYYMILSLFNARTSAFFGSRVEAYVIAKDINTGLMSWIIIDYISNTISYDDKDGLSAPAVASGYVTTDFEGNVHAQMDDINHQTELIVNLNGVVEKKLDYKLWVEGNLSISYGNKYSTSGNVFSLKFDAREMESALDVPLRNIKAYANNWFYGKVEEVPDKIVVFKYAQHFISDSPGHYSKIDSAEKLANEVEKIDFEQVTPYSTKQLTRNLTLVPLVLLIIIIILIVV